MASAEDIKCRKTVISSLDIDHPDFALPENYTEQLIRLAALYLAAFSSPPQEGRDDFGHWQEYVEARRALLPHFFISPKLNSTFLSQLNAANWEGFQNPTQTGRQTALVSSSVFSAHLDQLQQNGLAGAAEVRLLDNLNQYSSSSGRERITFNYPITDVITNLHAAVGDPATNFYAMVRDGDREQPVRMQLHSISLVNPNDIVGFGKGTFYYLTSGDEYDGALQQVKYYLSDQERERVMQFLSHQLKDRKGYFFISEAARTPDADPGLMYKMLNKFALDVNGDPTKEGLLDRIVYFTVQSAVTQDARRFSPLLKRIFKKTYTAEVHTFCDPTRNKNYDIIVFSA